MINYPLGEEATTLYTEAQEVTKPALYTDSMRVASLITLFVSIVFVIYYRYLKNGITPLENGLSLGQNVFMLVSVGILLRMILTVTAPQCSIDVNLFKYWAREAGQT